MKVAMGLFNTWDCHATSMADILHARGVQKDNLQFHFKSKGNLAPALIEEARGDYMPFPCAERAPGEDIRGRTYFGNMALEMGDTNPQAHESWPSVPGA